MIEILVMAPLCLLLSLDTQIQIRAYFNHRGVEKKETLLKFFNSKKGHFLNQKHVYFKNKMQADHL